MSRPVAAVEYAMEVQAALHALRKHTLPLWTAALASGDWTLMAEVKALAATLRSASAQTRRIAGLTEPVESGLLDAA